MKRLFNKKASLNLSVEAIVIVVIAFVVLGLGLGFVRGQFEQMTSTSSSVQEQISQQILDDLRTGNKKLSFPATSLNLETKELDVQAIGIKNTEDGDRVLKIGFQVKDGDTFSDFVSQETFTFADGATAKIDWDNTEQILNAGESRVYPVSITAPSLTDNYLYKIVVYYETETAGVWAEFDSKTFFIKTT
ncbi:MAG: hypothetical protein ABIG93_02485 [archaeon]|nr:hypothetical protein [Nanoarchaeota archaeon]